MLLELDALGLLRPGLDLAEIDRRPIHVELSQGESDVFGFAAARQGRDRECKTVNAHDG